MRLARLSIFPSNNYGSFAVIFPQPDAGGNGIRLKLAFTSNSTAAGSAGVRSVLAKYNLQYAENNIIQNPVSSSRPRVLALACNRTQEIKTGEKRLEHEHSNRRSEHNHCGKAHNRSA